MGDFDPRGVNERLVLKVREALDRDGFESVKIVVSGGFTVDRIRAFEQAGVPVDAYGVGSSLLRGANDFTADVVVVDGKPGGKVGRELAGHRLSRLLDPCSRGECSVAAGSRWPASSGRCGPPAAKRTARTRPGVKSTSQWRSPVVQSRAVDAIGRGPPADPRRSRRRSDFRLCCDRDRVERSTLDQLLGRPRPGPRTGGTDEFRCTWKAAGSSARPVEERRLLDGRDQCIPFTGVAVRPDGEAVASFRQAADVPLRFPCSSGSPSIRCLPRLQVETTL
jgi:hypothetical protein